MRGQQGGKHPGVDVQVHVGHSKRTSTVEAWCGGVKDPPENSDGILGLDREGLFIELMSLF